MPACEFVAEQDQRPPWQMPNILLEGRVVSYYGVLRIAQQNAGAFIPAQRRDPFGPATVARPSPTMAEPASLIGAISASLHLVKEIANYFNSFHDAPKHAADLSEELVAVSHVLGMLRKALEERTANVRFDRTSVLFFAASGCRRRLQAVHDALAPLFAANHVLRLFRRITWPFSREETLEDVQAIHRFAQVFHFATTVEGLYVAGRFQVDCVCISNQSCPARPYRYRNTMPSRRLRLKSSPWSRNTCHRVSKRSWRRSRRSRNSQPS